MIEMNWQPDAKTLRNFGWIALAGFGFLATIAHFEWLVFAAGLGAAKPWVVDVFVGLAVYSGVCGLVYPRANYPVYIGLAVASYPIGFVLSYVILGALFYLVITPVGLVMRLAGRDPLDRRFHPEAATYWRDCRPARPQKDYFRQF